MDARFAALMLSSAKTASAFASSILPVAAAFPLPTTSGF